MIACALALAGAPAAVAAQRVTGTIIDAPSRLGIAGAVLLQADAGGRTLSRALSGVGGRFVLVLDPNARSVRVVRLGYVARELSLADVERGEILLQRIPLSMDPIRVAAKGCPVRADDRRALVLLDQARAGLLAAVVSREAEPISAVRLRFERQLERDGSYEAQRVRIDSAAGTRTTFVTARSGAELAERGFLEETEAGGLVLHAPDADVFLDDAFVDAYCFREIRPSADRPHQVGLGFSPAGRRRSRIDVEGTVWVDTAGRELREIQFRYVGLPREIDIRRPGGHITFLALSNGLVLVDRWQLRLVGITADTLPTPGMRGRAIPFVRERVLVSESGGEVAAARWTGDAYEASLGALGLLVQIADSQPAAGVVLRLEGTDYRATTDSAGRARIDRLLPGPYALVVLDPKLAAIDLPLETGVRFTAQRDSLHVAAFPLPTVPPSMARHCESRRVLMHSLRDTIPWILGRVRRADGGLIAPGTIRVRREVRTGTWEPVEDLFQVGTDGVFWICSKELAFEREVRIEYQVRGGRVHQLHVALQRDLTVVPLDIEP